MDSECKCTYPNYAAFTGRCMTCGGFHKKDLNMGFDYKSRDWEESNSRPVCVACLNESRAHQIPGNYEHICGKQIDNTQLPAEVVVEINKKAEDYMGYVDMSSASYSDIEPYEVKDAWKAGATEYASKLHQVEQENAQLKQWKAEASEILNPILQYGQSKEAAIPLGQSITEVVLERCKRLHHEEKKNDLLEEALEHWNNKATGAIDLLKKFISRHEAGLLPDRFIYDEIKTFLDGTK